MLCMCASITKLLSTFRTMNYNMIAAYSSVLVSILLFVVWFEVLFFYTTFFSLDFCDCSCDCPLIGQSFVTGVWVGVAW